MRLRLIHKLIASVFAACAAVFAASSALSGEEDVPKPSADFLMLTDFAEATRGGVLTVGGPAVEYALPPSAGAVRILSNANLRSIIDARAQRQADAAKRWQYAIEVEECDADGNTLRKRVHHARRDLVEVEMPGGRSGTGAFYLEERAPAPLPAASLKLTFPDADRPARIRIRLVSVDPDIADLLVRVAVPPPASQRAAETVWRRLSDDQRAQLASGNVFPPKLLTEQERASLIASRWMPVGPMGKPSGRDIYLLKGDDIGAPVDAPKPEALMVRPGRAVSVQLPENGARVRIVLEAEDDRQRASDKVSLRWLGHSPFLRRTSGYKWNGDRFELQDNFGGGWLEIDSTRSAIVRVVAIENGTEKEITPPMQYLRAWEAREDAPLEFSISHAGDAPTPFRLVMRRSGSAVEATSTAPVAMTLLAENGEVIRTIRLHPQFSASRYDAPWPEAAGMQVSDPWETFFSLPPAVRKVRITSAQGVLANAYSRPENLPRAVRMPEDVHDPESAKTAIPGWFMLSPDAYATRILDGDSSLLMVQTRLPDERPELVAGRYQWEDFDPAHGGAARIFLAPREEGVPDRKDAIAGTFRPIANDGPADFAAAPGHVTVAPRLAWRAGTGGSFRYRIMLDDQEWLSGVASGSAGEMALPPFSPGRHHVRIASDSDATWYSSHLGSGTAWVRRRAYRLDKPMSFDIERTTLDEEFVTVRLFRPAGTHSRTSLRVKISSPETDRGIGPFPGWLFTEREYDIRPGGQLALPIAETDAEKTDAGQPITIPLPEGAPRGRYRITVTPGDASGWIAVSRVTPGTGARTALILERLRDEQ